MQTDELIPRITHHYRRKIAGGELGTATSQMDDSSFRDMEHFEIRSSELIAKIHVFSVHKV
jgi:hypothetical protein